MKRLAYALAGVIALAAVLLVAFAPALVDTPAVRAEIQRRLASAVDGEVAWDSLRIALFPAPHGELRNLRLEIPATLSATVEEVQVDVRLWPLLRGSVEVSSVVVRRPNLDLAGGAAAKDEPLDAVAAYRKLANALAQSLQRFAPDTALRIEDAALGDFRNVSFAARTGAQGVDLEARGESRWWKRLTATGRMEYADLATRAQIDVEGLVVDNDVPAAELRMQLHAQQKAIQVDFHSRIVSLAAAQGKLVLADGAPPQATVHVSALDLAQALAIARRKVPGLGALESAEGHVWLTANAVLAEDWQAEIDVTKSSGALKLAQLPWAVAVQRAHVALTPHGIRVGKASGHVGASPFDDAQAQIELSDPTRLTAASAHAMLDLDQWFPWLAARLPLEAVDAMSGKVEVTLKRLALRFDRPQQADFDAVAKPHNVSASLKALPGTVRIDTGRVAVTPRRLSIAALRGSLGDSKFTDIGAELELKPQPRVLAARGRASVELAQWLPMLALDDVTSLTGKLDVALARLALRFDRPKDADFEAIATPREVSATLKMLPSPIALSGGSVRVDSTTARIDQVAVRLLDAATRVSGTVALGKPSADLVLSQGTLGEKAVRWTLERAGVPARFEPRTPLRFSAQRVAWAAQGALEADARIEFDGGPALGVALAWRPELFELRRLTLKDARTDAAFGATIAGELIQASFSGTLSGTTIPAMLREPLPTGGVARGELRVTIDRKQPERTQVEGKVAIEALDLTWLTGKKAVVERAEIVAERDGARITGARFGWEDQFFELSGAGRRTEEGPVIDARIASDGVMLERLLSPADPNAPRKQSSALWPLPVSGRVELSAGFVQYKDYRIEPLDGVLTLERNRARIEVKRARMCGVSFPTKLEFEPDSASAVAHVSMDNEPLERTVRCLTGGELDMTGTATLKAELRIVGRRPHLVRGLAGTVEADVRDGRVKKFALLGNILAFRGIASLDDMKSDGFPYRRMTARGRFDGGRFLVDEAFFDSSAARLAASGHVDLLGPNSQLNVLVAPLTTVERVVGAIPLLGDVFGGTMVALPIAVNGDIRNPVIVPLGPRAVTEQLLGIFERTLKLPGKLVPAP